MNEAIDRPSTDDRELSVLLCTDYLPPSGGGVEAVVQTLARRLVSHGVDVTIFTLESSKDDSFDLINDDTIDVFTVPTLDLTAVLGLQSRLSPTAPKRFLDIVKTQDPDVIHIHNRFFFTSLIAACWRLLSTADIPLVMTAHVGAIDGIGGASGKVAQLYESTASRFVLRSNDVVVSVSESVASHIEQFGPSGDAVIENAVDTDEYYPISADDGSGEPRVLYVGRLVHNKGPQTFVEALSSIFEEVPEARADIVGPGQLRGQLEQRCRELGIYDRVVFHGYVEEVDELMRNADVFCLPSFGEGLPLTLLEAMASGLPVVVTPVGGIPDIIRDGETGRLVPTGDPDAVGDTVIDLLKNPDASQAMGSRAREYVVTNNSWDHRTERILGVYESVVQS